MKIKQMFCDHIWMLKKTEFSHTFEYTHLYVRTSRGVEHRKDDVNILYFECVKCGLTKILEQKTNVTE